jgi:hypothetical protein
MAPTTDLVLLNPRDLLPVFPPLIENGEVPNFTFDTDTGTLTFSAAVVARLTPGLALTTDDFVVA